MSNNDKLTGIAGAILGVPAETIRDELTSTDVDTWDSLNHINLINAIEEEFGVSFKTDAMEQLKSVHSLKKELLAMGIVFDA
jgi:acyl carrier protein